MYDNNTVTTLATKGEKALKYDDLVKQSEIAHAANTAANEVAAQKDAEMNQLFGEFRNRLSNAQNEANHYKKVAYGLAGISLA